MSIASFIGFIIVAAFANHIRGGMFQKFYQNTYLWKIVATLLIGAAAYVFLPVNAIWAGVIAVTWFLFMLYIWGPWHDIGTIDPDYSRGGFLKPLYVWLGNKIANQKIVDTIMMLVRGLFSFVIFVPLAYLVGNWHVALLTFPASVAWTFGYVLDRLIVEKNYSEYFAGAAIGFMITLAFLV